MFSYTFTVTARQLGTASGVTCTLRTAFRAPLTAQPGSSPSARGILPNRSGYASHVVGYVVAELHLVQPFQSRQRVRRSPRRGPGSWPRSRLAHPFTTATDTEPGRDLYRPAAASSRTRSSLPSLGPRQDRPQPGRQNPDVRSYRVVTATIQDAAGRRSIVGPDSTFRSRSSQSAGTGSSPDSAPSPRLMGSRPTRSPAGSPVGLDQRGGDRFGRSDQLSSPH